MTKKNPFPSEADTQPAVRRPRRATTTKMPAAHPRAAGAAGEDDPRARPTERPPKASGAERKRKDASRSRLGTRRSGVEPRRPGDSDRAGAIVDEVVADLSRDPRREEDE
jgi:hypothetical protein